MSHSTLVERVTLICVSVIALINAIVASYVAAQRAIKISPLEAHRTD